MPQVHSSYWITIALGLVNKSDLTEVTVDLSNKAWLDPGDSATRVEYLPIIIGGTRIGTASDREVILPEAGSIRIDNSIGSFGVDRKFSDILERYEIIGRPIYILFGTSEIGALSTNTNQSSYYGKVFDWSHVVDTDRPTIEIRFDSNKIPKRAITKAIDSTTYPSAPLGNLNKHLPIVIGEDVQVRGIATTASGASTPSYSYATTLNSEHPVGGVNKYYVKDLSGDYTQVLSASNVSTAVLSQSPGSASSQVLTAKDAAKDRDSASFAFKLNTINFTTSPYIITQIDIDFVGQNNGSAPLSSGVILCDIYTCNAFTGAPDVKIASSFRNSASFLTSMRGASDYLISWAFDKPVILHNQTNYFIVLTQTEVYNTSAVLINTRFQPRGAVGSVSNWVKPQGSQAFYEAGTIELEVYLYGLKMNDVSTGSNIDTVKGLGDAYFSLEQRAAISGYSNPDISQFDWIVEIDGLKDDSTGTITGSANSLITTAHDAIKLLSQELDGSAWEPVTDLFEGFDFTEYANTYFAGNTIAGATEGETTYQQWLRQVCRNSATRVVLLNNGKVAPYSWGATIESAATFTQNNSKINRVEKLDPSYVLNSATIAYSKALIYFDSAISASQGIQSDYTAISKYNTNTSAEYADLIGNSVDLYGSRELADIYFNWIKTSAAAERIARYYLTSFKEPPIYVELEVPQFEFAQLNIMSVVTIINPSLPNYYGGIPNAKLPHFEGEEATNFNAGYVLCEAQEYRAQIESKFASYNEDAVPTLSLVCRLLTNYPNDPT